MWILVIIAVVMGLTYIVFAFVEPPEYLRGFFRVPAIFLILPEKYVMPVGRIFAGLLMLGFAVFLAWMEIKY